MGAGGGGGDCTQVYNKETNKVAAIELTIVIIKYNK